MTDWKYELTEAVIVAIVALLLFLFRDNYMFDAAIFTIGVIFCIYDASSRKELEYKIQWHWLLLALITSAVLYMLQEISSAFLCVYFLLRFFISMMRRGETKDFQELIDKINKKHRQEIEDVSQKADSELALVLHELESKKSLMSINLHEKHQEELQRVRMIFETAAKNQIKNIEVAYERRISELQNIYEQRSATMESDLRAEIETEKNKSLENFKACYEFKLRELSKRLDFAESELENKQNEIVQLKIDHATEIEHIKTQLNDESQQVMSNLTRDIICEREEYDTILSNLRYEFEMNYTMRVRELETEHQTRMDALSKILQDNQKEFNEERADLERQKDREIANLQSTYQSTLAILNDRLNEQDEYIQSLEGVQTRQQNEIYTNKELHKLLQQTLRKAKVEVDIMSPWVNRAIFGKLEKQIEKLLIRGVILKIVYGIENNNYSDAQAKNDRVESFVRELQAKFGNYKNFYINKINSHGKMFICDDEYYVLTSMNPLSNKGDSWEEIGEKSYNKRNLLAYRKKYFNYCECG